MYRNINVKDTNDVMTHFILKICFKKTKDKFIFENSKYLLDWILSKSFQKCKKC